MTSLERARAWMERNRTEGEDYQVTSLASLLDAHATRARKRALEEAAVWFEAQVVRRDFTARASARAIRALKKESGR